MDELREKVWAELQAAIAEDRLSADQMRALIEILGQAAERAGHGGPTASEVERN